MKHRFLKSWKTSTVGLMALIGLGINVYSNGLSVSDFLLLVVGVGFIAYKEKEKEKEDEAASVDPDKEFPDEKG